MTPNIMTHDEAREVLEALAIDALEAFESAAALAHVAECDACTEALDALRRAAEQLAYASSPVPMSLAQRNRVRGRLLARVEADRADSRSTRPARLRPAIAPIVWGAIAAGVIAAVSLVATMRAALADRDQLIANLTGTQVAVMSLAAVDPGSPSARMFWDRQHDAWTFVAHGLTSPRQGRTYQLWLVTPTSKISAGTFTPLANGDAVVRATYRLDARALAAVAVTDEPAGGSAQPTTPPLLAVSGVR